MTKKVTILITAVLIFVSMNLLAQHGTRGRDMVKHARYGIHPALRLPPVSSGRSLFGHEHIGLRWDSGCGAQSERSGFSDISYEKV